MSSSNGSSSAPASPPIPSSLGSGSKTTGVAKGGGEPVRDEMEGLLYKWTNYIKGYQKRWIVLKAGRLSYYRFLSSPSILLSYYAYISRLSLSPLVSASVICRSTGRFQRRDLEVWVWFWVALRVGV